MKKLCDEQDVSVVEGAETDTRGRYVAKTEVTLAADREIDYKLVFKSVSRGRSATLASL